jgi:MoxR-like ATPase
VARLDIQSKTVRIDCFAIRLAEPVRPGLDDTPHSDPAVATTQLTIELTIEHTIELTTDIETHTMSHHGIITELRDWLSQQIIGQERLIDRLLIALLADGHLLVEGAPGLAKTKAIKDLSRAVEGDFHRIQFTPDLLPSDITGTEVFRPEDGSFRFQKGPIFHNLVLADEINRAPAKVQSALLEAMAEHQVSVGRESFTLPPLFLVMATQNPIEQEGTYPLPEAQLDRFLMHVAIGYPAAEAERSILKLVRDEAANVATTVPKEISQDDLFAARQEILAMHMAPEVEEYLIQLIMATREPAQYGDDLAGWLEYGASPRGTISLDRCARAHAWIQGRDFVSPDDVQEVMFDVLRHRILLSFEAEASGVTPDQVLEAIRQRVPSA